MLYAARDASAFIGSIGVNVHVGWPGPYADTAKVISGMHYLGLSHVRDFMTPASAGVFDALAANGFRFDLMCGRSVPVADYIRMVRNLEAAHPGSVFALEGPNEVNSWAAEASALQRDLYTQAKADPLLAAKPVFAATIAGLDPNVHAQLQVDGFADYGNVHIYFNGGMPKYGVNPLDPTWAWANWLRSGNISAPGRPVVVTETGASSAAPAAGVDEPTQAKQILNALMDAAETGTPATYLYELVESRNDGDKESHFGLFRYDWTPKPAADAVHNFTRILTDGGPAGGLGALDYTLQGAPPWGGHLLFQEGDGAMDVVVWAEPDIWNERARAPIPAPATQVTLDLAAPANVAIFDPMRGAAPELVFGTTSRATFSVTDHPLIVEIKAPVVGSDGDDGLQGGPGSNYLYGGAGDDWIAGGAAFNQVSGGGGADTIVGGSSVGDRLAGGQGGDRIDVSPASGHNLVNGNFGADTILGGAGGDNLRGGQGDDLIVGGPGSDWISGDRGQDTLTGGGGADVFRQGSGGGTSVVTDFRPAEGDRIELAPGVAYALAQAGADVVVDLSDGGRIILRQAPADALLDGWILQP